MVREVAICAAAAVRNAPDIWHQRCQGMLLEVFEAIVGATGVTFDPQGGVRTVVTCSDDVFDARTISDNAVTDVVGAHFRAEEKVSQDGLNALGYALACIRSGHDDLVLVMGHCKESQSENRRLLTNLAFDPFYGRPLGLDYVNAGALQARAYQQRSGITESHLAELVVRSRRHAARNPLARENPLLTADEVLASPLLADPLRELHVYPVTDWAVGMLLAAGERVAEFTDKPVWLRGFASAMDGYFLGERNLGAADCLQSAVRRACRRSGVSDPAAEIDLFELNDAMAHQLPLWAEGVGLAPPGGGAAWLDAGGPDRRRVNLSGGMLNGNPLMLGGLARALEAFQQLRGEAGARQADGLRRALAHGTTGPAAQHHAVLILER
jgi:acetyl-CoA C-acetyltransferase